MGIFSVPFFMGDDIMISFKKKEAESIKDTDFVKTDIEDMIIAYILEQSKNNNISLAQKDNITYISFRQGKIKEFLGEWYSILRLYQNNKLSSQMYEVFIQSKIKELPANKVYSSSKEEVKDLYADLFQ